MRQNGAQTARCLSRGATGSCSKIAGSQGESFSEAARHELLEETASKDVIYPENLTALITGHC